MSAAAGVVLAGGSSTRMGAPKASLPWDGATLLARVVAAVAPAVERVVVVGAPGQDLPPLPAGVDVVDDAIGGRGPLEGIAAGLAAVAPGHDRALVAAVDLPWLTTPLAARVLAALGDDVDAAVPTREGRPQPLLAAYRTALAADARALLDAGERRARALMGVARVRLLDEDALLADPAVAAADPALRGLRDVDTPADLIRARVWRVTT
ncbi:MAG: molybdenum cofactor guanylyltransferase [Thermoleophilia bacterium]